MKNIKAVYRYIKAAEREVFKHAKCLLTISVGQEVHEAEMFQATIDLVSETFESCILMVDDSLQRHTMALNLPISPEELYYPSLSEGELWLKRNEKYIAQLKNIDKIIHWDRWLQHPNYKKNQQVIIATYKSEPTYQDAFELTIREFLTRYSTRLIDKTHYDPLRAHRLCFDYLVEECTAMTLWPELACHYEVYPSRRNLAMDMTHKRFVLNQYPDLLHAVGVKFKNREQLKPQQFNLDEISYNEEKGTSDSN